ncbi:RICIN domain-containing protein [Paenibacillus sp. FSL L8-0470]|uniref:RICIN domain-containing protein n=1 Tax=Paenibacillus sp. FSL L8-0470 TaxID=2954688 RepID=UPI0030FA2D8B
MPKKNEWCDITNKNSNQVADVKESSTVQQANIYQWPYHGGSNQLWMFVPLNNGYYAIVNKNSGQVADVEKYSMQSGANIYQHSWHGESNQQWFLHDLGDGSQKISNLNSGHVWDVEKYSMQSGANIYQHSWHGENNQRWTFHVRGSFTLPSIQTYPLAPPPNYKSINDVLPDRTEMVTTNYTLAPCIGVGDPQKNDQQKIQTNPYYLYVRKQYWSKVASHVLAPGTSYGYKQTSGMTTTDQKTVTNTVSHTFGADVGLSFGNLQTGKKSLSAALSYQYSNELSVQESRTETELSVVEEAFIIENTNKHSVAWTKYILVSQYSVQRIDGTIVNEPWTVTDYHNTYDCFYPLGENGIVDRRVSVETNETIFD